MAAVSASSQHTSTGDSIGTSKSNGTGSSSAHVEFADDPLSPVVDRDISDSNLRRVASSDTASSIQTIQPSASASSSAALFGTDRRGSDGATASPLDGPSNGPYNGSVYNRTSSVEDGYKSGWAAYASTEHLNPNERSHDGDDYSRRGLSGRPANGTAATRYSDSPRPEAGENGEEEGDEARQVQQNLERWAAAEKQRRKAARTSRSSFLGPPETGSLARRLTFGRKANPASYVETEDASPVDKNASLLRNVSGTAASISSSNDSMRSESRRGSADSGLKHESQGSPVRAGADGPKSLEDVPEHDDDNDTLSPRGNRNKGKGRALDHAQSPFADPSESSPQQQKRRSLKPTASRPIVTPGRAPSIRRTPADTPQIIATDVDAQQQQSDRQQRRFSRNGTPLAAENPFLSASEAVQAAEKGGHYRPRTHEAIQEDERDIGMPSMTRATTWESVSSTTSAATTTQPSARYSMSKFREVGLDVSEGEEEESVPAPELERRRQLKRVMTGDDESSTTRSGRYDRRHQEAEEDRRRVREGKGRQPWWTEWLCGCGRVIDDDNEQTGKTGPE